MSDKKFEEWVGEAQKPSYDVPWTGPTTQTRGSKPAALGLFHCRVFLIHRPPGACWICRKERGTSDDEEDGDASIVTEGKGAANSVPLRYEPCAHNENVEYVNLINSVAEKGGRIVKRDASTLKNGDIQVHVEWVDAPSQKKPGA